MAHQNDALSNEVADVAQQIADESAMTNRKLPALLLQLKKLIDSVLPLGDDMDNIIHDVWQLKLVDVVAVVLKMDFTAVPPDGWTTAEQLVGLTVHCFVSEQGLKEFCRDERTAEMILLTASEGILECCRNCQVRYCGLNAETVAPASASEKIYCLRALKAMFSHLNRLVEAYPHLTASVIRSANLGQVLMSEVDDATVVAISFLGKLYDIQPSTIPADFDASDYVEELLFKLATTDSTQVAREAVATLTKIINDNGRYAYMVNSKFKGVKEMVAENWSGRLYLREEELKDFFRLIDMKDSVKQSKRAGTPEARAILLIQAFMRSYLARKRLKAANACFSKLQANWRERKKREALQREEKKKEETARFQMFLGKKLRVRRGRQELLKQMLSTPPERFPGFLRTLEQSAASRIQATWRGHRVRRRYEKITEEERQNRAATQIQSSYRRYRARTRKLVDSLSAPKKNLFALPELTPERRSELEREIHHTVLDFKARNAGTHWSRDRLEVLHNRGQDVLADYYRRVIENRRAMHDCTAARAHIELDLAALRDNCPSLEAATTVDADRLACVSRAVRSRAAKEHKQTLETINGPWWASFHHEIEREQEEYRRLLANCSTSVPPPPAVENKKFLIAEKDVSEQ